MITKEKKILHEQMKSILRLKFCMFVVAIITISFSPITSNGAFDAFSNKVTHKISVFKLQSQNFSRTQSFPKKICQIQCFGSVSKMAKTRVLHNFGIFNCSTTHKPPQPLFAAFRLSLSGNRASQFQVSPRRRISPPPKPEK